MNRGGLFADTIQEVQPRRLERPVLQALLEFVCRKRGHRWERYAVLKHGRRDYCLCCHGGRAVVRGEVIAEWSFAEQLAADPKVAEALYEVRWGEPPRRRLKRGEWPAP
jgi:hypothetical protein